MPFGRPIAQGLLVAVIAVASTLLYAHRLDFAPPDIQIDEAIISINAHQIATTGRDLRGERLPLYAQTAEHSWYQPLVIYLTAAALTVLPLNEWSIRLPAIGMAVLAIVLMYLVASRATRRTMFGVAAAAMLALTPSLFIHSRYAMDYHYPLVFILTWLYCLLRFDESRQRRWLATGTAVLGVGFYCYISSIVMMPIYLLMTLMWLFMRREQPRSYGVAIGAMAPLLLPFVVWLALHPQAYSATVDKYGLYDSHDLNPVQGLRSAFGFLSVGQRLSQYWNYYDPSLLFFGSGIKVQFSTSGVGVFLLPMAILILAGMYASMKRRAEPFYLVALLGFLTAPIAASIPTEENAIFRALGLLPFGVLLAVAGLERLWDFAAPRSLAMSVRVAGSVATAFAIVYGGWALAKGQHLGSSTLPLLAAGLLLVVSTMAVDRKWTTRTVVTGLLLFMPLQFAGFWNDYFTAYRERVSFWLGGNIGGAMEEVIDHADGTSAPIYFATLKSAGGNLDWRNGFMDAYWHFYAVKHQREDLLRRATPIDEGGLAGAPPGTLIVSNTENAETNALVTSGVLKKLVEIDELDGRTFFVVLQR